MPAAPTGERDRTGSSLRRAKRRRRLLTGLAVALLAGGPPAALVSGCTPWPRRAPRQERRIVVAVPNQPPLQVIPDRGGPAITVPSGLSIEWVHARTDANCLLAEAQVGLTVELVGLPMHSEAQGDSQSLAGPDELGQALAQGMVADLVAVPWSSGLNQMVDRGLVQPLDRLVRGSRGLRAESFPPRLLEGVRLRGQLWAVPFTVVPLVLWYEPAAFEAAGLAPPNDQWTWETLATTAAALTSPRARAASASASQESQESQAGQESRDGQAAPEQWGLLGGELPYDVLIRQAGGELFTPDLKQTRLREPPALEAIRFGYELCWRYRATPPDLATSAVAGGPLSIASKRAGRVIRGAMAYFQALAGPAAAHASGPQRVAWMVPPPRGRVRATRARLW